MVTAIVGANWGDEGKGKITDMCADTYYHRVFFMITRQVLLVMVLRLIFPIFSMRSMRL